MSPGRLRPVALGLALAPMYAASAGAQHVRVTGITTFQYVDVRPLREDSIPAEDASGSGLLRRSPDGYAVRCVSGDQFCRFRRPDGSTSNVPVIQDITANVWGLGRGIRGYARVRGRAMAVGEEALWPRSGDHFDVVSAYLEMDRTVFRARIGRLWKSAGLGYYNYDGASVLLRPLERLTVEGYGGRGLLSGLNEPLTNDDLAAIEPFAPETGSYVVGAQLSFRPRPGAALTALYQREIRDDRLGLYSERLAVDGTVRVGVASLDAGLKVDWATGTLNEGRFRVWLPASGPVAVNLYGRHYRPYFDLWTIWGAFTPVAYDELGVGAAWRSATRSLGLEAWGAMRRYSGSDAEDLFGKHRSDGWRIGASASAALTSHWNLDALYRADVGFGAARSDGSARLRRLFGDDGYVAVNAAAFQRLYELRVDEGTALALGVDGGVRYGARTRISGGLTVYRHDAGDGVGANWTQVRGSLRLEWTVGAEPAAYRRRTIP